MTPEQAPDFVRRDPNPDRGSRRLVVCSLEPWDEVWRRNQYLVDSLLRRDPRLEVLFIEPSADPLHMVRRGNGGVRRGRGLRVVDGYQGRLRAFEPTKWAPRRLGALADILLRRDVRRVVRGLGWRSPLLWVNDPSWAGLLAATGWPALYDITDDWLVAARGTRELQRLARAEEVLLAECAEVVVCSTALARTKGAGRSVTLVGNAVDLERYRRPVSRPDDFPQSPVALYLGTLHTDRLDVELVIATGRRLSASGGRLVLVGPNALDEPQRSRVRTAPGVEVLGGRPWTDVPAYLQHADVLVVPHVVDEFTDSLDPIKLYEYLAVGRPLVSTPVAGFRELASRPGVVLAGGDAFVSAVAAAAGSRAPDVRHDGIPDWNARAADMRTVLDRVAEARP